MTKEEAWRRTKGYLYDVLSAEEAEEIIHALEQEYKLENDGTLVVTTEHYKNVNRVLVQHGTNGTLFYKD